MPRVTKKQRVINYFTKFPLATPKSVSEKFGMAMPTVYTLRKQALASIHTPPPPADEPVVEQGWLDEEEQANKQQVGGDHYKNMGVEPWDVIDTWPTEQRIGAYRAGALKYLMRMGTKDADGLEIAKSKHYLQKLLEVLEEANGD
jgi:hypothetical protein